MASSAPKYTHQTYGVGIALSPTGRDYDEISKRHTAALARSMQLTKDGAVAAALARSMRITKGGMMKEDWKFSLNRKGLLILAARAAYMPHTAVPLQREITLSVYAKVEGSKPTSRGQSVRTWEQLQERMHVPANTPRNDQEAMLTFMMGVVSAREGIDYIMQSTISTRPPILATKPEVDAAFEQLLREPMQERLLYGA